MNILRNCLITLGLVVLFRSLGTLISPDMSIMGIILGAFLAGFCFSKSSEPIK